MDEHKGTVLVIEDGAPFRRIYQDVLSHDGYRVVLAEDGEMGLEMAHREKPDLILLDLILPKLHGFDVLQNLRTDTATRDIPVIIFSTMGEQKDIQRGLELGANDYTVKGFYSPREILNKIRVLLSQSQAGESTTLYDLSVKEGRGDAARLQQDIGLTGLFACPHCDGEIHLQLIPDHGRGEGHWFMAHFMCQNCRRSF